MACNVFGDPITDETLKALPKYKGKDLTSQIRAAEALNMKNVGGKDIKARNYILGQKNDWDNYVEKMKNNANLKDKTCCMVLIYNATGDFLTYTTSHDFKGADGKAMGNIGRSPYPSRIANGQWGAFLHVQTRDTTVGCKAAVVYRGKIIYVKGKTYKKFDWMFGWYNPGDTGSYNTTICGEVRDADYFQGDAIWKSISDNMKAQHSRDEPVGGASGFGGAFEGTSGRGVASICEAILKLGKEV